MDNAPTFIDTVLTGITRPTISRERMLTSEDTSTSFSTCYVDTISSSGIISSDPATLNSPVSDINGQTRPGSSTAAGRISDGQAPLNSGTSKDNGLPTPDPFMTSTSSSVCAIYSSTEVGVWLTLSSTDLENPTETLPAPVISPTATSATANLFQLSINLSRSFSKRQSNVYLGGSGQATDSCTNGVIFSLSNGQLFANGTDFTQQFGTSPGVPFANFTPSANPVSIMTLFSIDTQNTLIWSNDAFFNYRARFCVTTGGDLLAVFVDPQLAPTGCLFVVLMLSRLERCAGLAMGPRYLILLYV